MNRSDWALLAIASADGSSVSPVQLQKALFLLGEDLPKTKTQSFYEFEPYHYGPFDQAVYSDAEKLSREGLVSIVPGPQLRNRVYVADGSSPGTWCNSWSSARRF